MSFPITRCLHAYDSLSLLELKVLPHTSWSITQFLARSEQQVALAVQILNHIDYPMLLFLTHPYLSDLVILVWLQLHQYPVRHFAIVWLILRHGTVREHVVHSTGPFGLAIVDARPLVSHYPLVKRQLGSRWIEAIGLVWVRADEGGSTGQENLIYRFRHLLLFFLKLLIVLQHLLLLFRRHVV